MLFASRLSFVAGAAILAATTVLVVVLQLPKENYVAEYITLANTYSATRILSPDDKYRQIVMHVAKEVAPIAAFGGMAQLTGGLANGQALTRAMEVFHVIPMYSFLDHKSKVPSLRLRMDFADRTELVSVFMLSHSAQTISAELLAWSADRWELETRRCTLDTMVHDLLTMLPRTLVESVNVPSADPGRMGRRRCLHYLLVEPPSRLAKMWRETSSEKHIYTLPPDVSYSTRDVFFGSAAAYLAAALQNAAQSLLQVHSGQRPLSTTAAAKAQAIQLTRQFLPVSLAQASDPLVGSNAAHELALIAAQPTLQLCPSIVLQIHGATNSVAAFMVRDLVRTNCPVTTVYTLHDFTSEKSIKFAAREIRMYTRRPIDKAAFSKDELLQRSDEWVVSSSLGLLQSQVASTVSDNLAATLAGSRPRESNTSPNDASIFGIIRHLASESRWFGTPNGIQRQSMPDRAPGMVSLGLSETFEPAANAYSRAPAMRGASTTELPEQSLLAVGTRIRAGKTAAKRMLIQRLEANTTSSSGSPLVRSSLSNVHSSLFVLFVGRFERLKGTDMLGTAAKWACEAGHVLMIAGEHTTYDSEGSAHFMQVYNQYVSAAFSSAPCKGSVVALQTREEQKLLLPLMRASADIAIVPSMMEAFGFVSIEALAHSAVVVAANVGGLPDTVMPQLPVQRLYGIGGATGAAATGAGRAASISVDASALWTGELFTRVAGPHRKSREGFLAALLRTALRLGSMQDSARLVHLAVLQRVAHSYCWVSNGRATVLGRWDAAVKAASQRSAADVAAALLHQQ